MPRVLIVEEQVEQARVMAIGLGIEGFDVETAGGSADALERLAAQSFDLAVVDLMLPGTNGIQLARMLRDQYPAMRVVLMSAYHLSDHQLCRADCGAAGFVPKPVDLGCLADFLRSKTPPESGAFGVHPEGRPGARARRVAGAAAPR